MSICSQAPNISHDHDLPYFPIDRSLEEDDNVWTRTRQEAANLSATINEILGSYDPKLRPNAGGESL